MQPSQRARVALEEAGFDLCVALPRADWDACVPEDWRCERIAPQAGSALLVGHGGRSLWSRFLDSPEARSRASDRLDDYTRRVLHEAAAQWRPEAPVFLYDQLRGDRFLPMLRLAERAGLGRPGRIGLLIHPEYGPWFGLRGVLLLPESAAAPPPLAASACSGCPAPCVAACPGGAVRGESDGTFDAATCADTRVRHAPCRHLCAAREACVVGRDHRYTREQQLHHGRASAAWLSGLKQRG